ncbi:MAG: glutamate synthase (NADPH), homotetrameric [Phycisphaerae bacterium]|nr:MAG: glutamate synthase (NADPH), homotetrameric [Phycisphaerae bacterium]
MKITRQQMPEQDAKERAGDFREVNSGFTAVLARLEAERCLRCRDAKCIAGCPVGIDIPLFIEHIAEGDLPSAADVLLRDNALPGITGRVCPQEEQCEQQCVRGKGKGCSVAVGHLERFVADWARDHVAHTSPSELKRSGNRVAIVGSGPAGLTAAGELARLGHDVTIFEALHAVGGVLRYGIPNFRLPNEIIESEVARLTALGVTIETNVIVGTTMTIDELMTTEGYGAVFIANGAGLPVFMNIPGEDLNGVYSANEFLTRVNLMEAYRFPDADTPVIVADRAVVIGGGNTAMDSIRTARRLGATEATLVYRRSRTEMPARKEEVHHAEQEGIAFRLLCSPVRILCTDTGWVRGVECVEMELGASDASGRRRPVPISGSEFTIECDIVIEAIGTRANPLLTSTTPDIKVNKWGNIEIDEDGMTSRPGVFAGGDITRGAATVILAMGDGKRAAAAIDRFLVANKTPREKSHQLQ